MRPLCVNHGCKRLAMESHKDATGNVRYRVHCGHCQKASYGGHPHSSGVTPFKTGKCSNDDGHLGFNCCIDYKKAPWAVGMTEIDHINTDPHDNRLENLQELCPMCHKRKGRVNGDYKRKTYLA